ncbi:MAG: hypothetical protein mread185_000516 [Mycoplasmataceae bacterium]|nr:MAG: hypothetical protein mread185_000516 [Mycoplasmataceae bacterium]
MRQYKKIYELMDDAKNKLDWSPSGPRVGDILVGIITLNATSVSKLADYLKTAKGRMDGAYNILCDARNAINNCSCDSDRNYWKDEENKERQRANSNARGL